MMRRAVRLSVLVSLGAMLVGLSGCVAVKPWEREAFARPEMAWDPDPLESQLQNHIRFSKEAALPVGGGAGGGCGCN